MGIIQTFCLSLLLVIQISCSQLKVSSTPGRTPIFVGPQEKHLTPVEIVVEKDFYLWGFVPGQHNIDLEEEFRELGAVGVSRLSFEHRQSWSQWIFGVMSFGLYWSVEMRVQGLAKMGDETGWSDSQGRWR